MSIGFLLFGTLSIFISVFGFIILQLLPKTQRIKYTRITIHYSFKLVINGLNFFKVLNVGFKNMDQFKNTHGCLFIANHPCLLDIALFLSAVPNVDCIVKASAWKNPFFYAFVTYANYIKNLDPQAIVSTCIERLKKGENIIIFPEGTRSYPGKLLPFKRGFATITLLSQCQLVPIFIDCQPPILTKNNPWYCFPKKRVKYALNALGPLSIESILSGEKETYKASKILLHEVEYLFKEEVFKNGIH